MDRRRRNLPGGLSMRLARQRSQRIARLFFRIRRLSERTSFWPSDLPQERYNSMKPVPETGDSG